MLGLHQGELFRLRGAMRNSEVEELRENDSHTEANVSQ